jgi:hypothetical protein
VISSCSRRSYLFLRRGCFGLTAAVEICLWFFVFRTDFRVLIVLRSGPARYFPARTGRRARSSRRSSSLDLIFKAFFCAGLLCRRGGFVVSIWSAAPGLRFLLVDRALFAAVFYFVVLLVNLSAPNPIRFSAFRFTWER